MGHRNGFGTKSGHGKGYIWEWGQFVWLVTNLYVIY